MVERNLKPLERIYRLTELTSLDFRPPLRLRGYRSSSASICYRLLGLANLLFWRRGVVFFEFDDSVRNVGIWPTIGVWDLMKRTAPALSALFLA